VVVMMMLLLLRCSHRCSSLLASVSNPPLPLPFGTTTSATLTQGCLMCMSGFAQSMNTGAMPQLPS